MRWLEISIVLQAELVEPVAELLTRFAENGVAIESLPQDTVSNKAISEVIVRAWLPEDEKLKHKKRQIEEGIWHLSQITPIPTPEFNSIENQDWNEKWKASYKPIHIGKRLVIVPAWLDHQDPDRIPIYVQPGLAFGTGTHPTTQMCLEILERIVQPSDRILDLGCGSGILSIAAAKLGAEEVFALDVDPQAVASAHNNLSRNQVQNKIQLSIGSLNEFRASEVKHVDLVVANITTPVLLQLLEGGMAGVLRPGGKLVLSGMLDEQLEDVMGSARIQDLFLVATKRYADWRTLVLESKPPL